MGTGHDHSVGGQRSKALGMDVFVGDHIVPNAGVFQERVNVGVWREIPSVGTRTQVQHRTQP